MGTLEHLAHGYLFAKSYVIQKGFACEIDWQADLNIESLTKEKFLKEASWVILSSGMNEKVIQKVFLKIKEIMYDFTSIELINNSKEACFEKITTIFNHPGKINAIFTVAEYLSCNSLESIINQVKTNGIFFLQTFPYLGTATSYHLAKNLGLNVAKPDRHLIRISSLLGFNDPNDLCCNLSYILSEKVSVIDLVLWRYATLDKNYQKTIQLYLNRIRTIQE